MLLSVLVLVVCGLPYGAALHVGVDHEKMMKTNFTSPGDVFYTLDESGVESGSNALWRQSSSHDLEEVVMQIKYRGDRAGWGSVDYAFDVKLPPEASKGKSVDVGNGYSVIFRDTRMSAMGFGKHFYQKFAILPKGESDKKKALFTVRMDPSHLNTGGRIWKVFKGYCTMFRCFGTGASSSTWREIFCLPLVTVVRPGSIPRSQMREGEMYMWSPEVPYKCMWNLPDTSDNKGSTAPMSAEFFNAKWVAYAKSNGFKSNVLVEDNWKIADDPKGFWKQSSSAAKETALFLTISTALQEAFKVGGSPDSIEKAFN